MLRDDRGAAAVAEVVIVFPLVMTVVLLIAQFAVWSQATHAAQAAASQALSAARGQHGTAADGRSHADAVLDQLGRGPLEHVSIEVERGTEQTEVRLEGAALSVVPFLHLPVHAEAAGPSEEFRPDGGGQEKP